MEFIAELIKQAHNGDEEAKEKLIEIYSKRYKYIYDRNSNIKDIDKKYINALDIIISDYVKNVRSHSITPFIQAKLENVERTNNWDMESIKAINEPVTTLYKKSKNGDEKSRKQLIERYMYIVEEQLENIDTKLDKEDALQYGYLLLTRLVNKLVDNMDESKKSNISLYIHNYIKTCYPRTIAREEKKEENFYKAKKIKPVETNINNEIFELEFVDYINNRQDLNTKDKLIYMKAILECKTQTEISKEFNISRENISFRMKRNRYKFKPFMDKKL